MSAIKRWIDDEVEQIANATGLSWDDVMNCAIENEFDMELVEELAEKGDVTNGKGF